MKLFFALIFIFYTTTLYAGAHSNNGGATIVCSDMIEPLVIDLYLAKKDPNFKLALVESDAFTQAFQSISKLKKFNSELYSEFANNLALMKNTYSVEEITVTVDLQVGGYYHSIDVTCDIEFVAVQDLVNLQISKQWWKTATLENKVALILHELSYLHARRFGMWTADNVYPMVKFLLNKNSRQTSQNESDSLLAAIQWNGLYYFSSVYPLQPHSLVYDNNDPNIVLGGELAHDITETTYPDQSLSQLVIQLKAGAKVQFENRNFIAKGSAASLVLRKVCENHYHSSQPIFFTRPTYWYVDTLTSDGPFTRFRLGSLSDSQSCREIPISQNTIALHESGFPRQLHLSQPYVFSPRSGGRELRFIGEVNFNEQGDLVSGTVYEDSWFDCKLNGTIELVPAGSFLKFDEHKECVLRKKP